MNKLDIMYIRHNRLIEDPFPEESAKYREKSWVGEEYVTEISIWEAYRKGYEKAYQEILDSLKE